MSFSNFEPSEIIFNEEFNRSVLNSLTANIAVLDRQGQIIAVNTAWTQFANENNGRAEDARGIGVNYLHACLHAEQRGDSSARKARVGIESVLTGRKKEFIIEYPCHGPDQQRWFMMKVAPINHKNGVVIAHENITLRKLAEDQLQQSHAQLEIRVQERTAELEKLNAALQVEIRERIEAEKRLRQAATVFENIHEAIIVTDAQRNILLVNPAFTIITGYDAEEVMGKDLQSQESRQHSNISDQELWRSLELYGKWQGEIWKKRKNGETYPALESISTVKANTGAIVNYVSVFSDISFIKKTEDQLTQLAHHDQLTGLANRLLFAARLEQAIERAKRHKHCIALLFLDLDQFKHVNDTLGHAAGDLLLKIIGERIKGCIRDEDTVARLGGDEFTILLEEIQHAQDAASLANTLLQILAEEVEIDGFHLTTTVSIGISIYPDDADLAADLLRAADLAMYNAKAHGRNTYQFYHSELTDVAFERLSIENDLRRAMSSNELTVLYQPQFCPTTKRLVGMEALVRWEHPVQGLLLPERFIFVAEESGLIHDLDEWVLRTALKQVHEWQTEGLMIPRLAINISAREILHDHLGERIDRALHDNLVDPNEVPIELEITETILQRTNRMLNTLSSLRNRGISISIDDFGTGYSSLSQLIRLPVDAVKIDKSFLDNIHNDHDSQAIVTAIIAMGHSLGLTVIAEGVEEQSQLDYLRNSGCDVVQGFMLSRPLDAMAMRELLLTL